MKFSTATLLVSAMAAAPALASYFVPPSSTDIVQCGQVSVSWKGAAPFTVTVWPGCDQDANTDDPIATFETNSTSAVYTVAQWGGESIMFGVSDGNGNEDWTDDYKIAKNGNSACIGSKTPFSLPSYGLQGSGFNETIPSSTTAVPTTTAALGNVAGPSVTASAVHGGGLGNGAFSTMDVRSELIVLSVVAGSLFALF